MADTLKRLVGPVALSTSATTLYTVGTGVTTTLRNIHVANVTTNAVTFSLGINSAATANAVFYQYSIAGYSVLDWSGVLVMAANDFLIGSAAALSSLTLIVSGVESS